MITLNEDVHTAAHWVAYHISIVLVLNIFQKRKKSFLKKKI